MPKELSKIYQEIYTREIEVLVPEDRVIAESILRFQTCNQQTLDVENFLASSSAGADSDLLTTAEALDLTANLVTYDEQLRLLRFAHLSVQEFLEQEREKYKDTSNHRVAAITCLRLLVTGPAPNDLPGPTIMVIPPKVLSSDDAIVMESAHSISTESSFLLKSVGIITAPSLQDPRQALALSLGTISLPCRDFIPPDFCSQASSNIKYHSCM